MSYPSLKVSFRRGACLTALFALLCNFAAPAALSSGIQGPSPTGGRDGAPTYHAAPGSYSATQTQTSTVRRISLPTNDIIFDKQSQQIFASVPSRAGAGGNSVTPVEPLSGVAGAPVFVGSEPTALALSDNGQYLYVALDGSASVRRVDIASRTAGLQFGLGSSSLDGPYRAHDLAVLPGSPESVAVSKSVNNGGFSRAHSVYDNGVQRGQTFNSNGGATVVEFAASASTLYVADKGDLSSPALHRLSVSGEGLSLTSTASNLVGAVTDIKFDAGLFYASNGKVVNPETATVAGDFGSQGASALVAPDSTTQRVFFLTGTLFGFEEGTPRTLTIRAYDQVSRELVGTLDVPGVTGTASSLIRWGGNGLAFRTSSNQLFLIQTSLVPSSDPIPAPTPTPSPTPTPAPVAASVSRLEITTNDLLFDARRQVLYASRPSTLAGEGNSVTSIDPTTGAVGPPIFVGSEPAKLALSDNGQYLYVALDGAGGVRRVDLTTETAGLQFSLGGGGTMTARDMEVVPGDPATVVVSRQLDASTAPRFEGVAVYHNGVKRPQDTNSFSGANSIEFSDSASTLYGSDAETGTGFYRMAVDSNGVRNLSNHQGLPGGDIKYRAGLIYSQFGQVFDPVTLELKGRFDASGVLLPDPAARRVYFVSHDGGLRAFDMDTFVPVGAVPIPGMKGVPSSLVRWGANGLAFRTNAGEVYLVRSDLVPSSASVGSPIPTATPRPAPTPFPSTVRLLELRTNDIVYDPSGGTIYASIPGSAAQSPNSLVPVQPSTGSLGQAVFIGNEPGQLAISDNSQYIYVAQNATSAPGVRRFNVASQAAELQFPLGEDSFNGKFFVSDMFVLAGSPSSLAVARRNITSSSGDEGVAVYDDGVARPVVSPDKSSHLNSMIEPSASPSVLFNFGTNGGAVDRYTVDASGVSVPADRFVGALSAPDMRFAAGRLYGSNGRVVDPELRALVGTFARFGSDPFGLDLARPDAPNGRVFLVSANIVGSQGNEVITSIKIRAYDMWSFLPVGEINLGNVRGRAAGLIRWGARGLALRTTGGQLLLAESDLVGLPAANSVQFSSATFNGSEGDKVTITITRAGDTTGAAEVTYATTDLGARDKGDYTAAVGMIRFGPNETSKSFDVLLNEDAFAEGEESFNIALGRATDMTLGPLAVTTVKITDDDAVSGPSPVKDAAFDSEFFVRQHYADFLGRTPDQDGLNFWVGQVTGCGAADLLVCRINVSAAFFLSIENQETGYLTYRAHKAAFGNLAGKPVPLTLREHLAGSRRIGEGVEVGIGDWQARLEANKAAFFDEFVTTPRFASLYGGLTNAQYVDALNQNAGLALSPDERDALVNGLSDGSATRARVLRRVAEDSDFAAAERNRAFVLAQYFGYLRRDPDATDFLNNPDPNFLGYNFWLTKLEQFNGNFVDAEMVRAFIESIEYGNRFGQ